MALEVGDRVKHPTLHGEWGPGQVLAVGSDGKLTILFSRAGQKVLKGVALEKLSGSEAADTTLDNRMRSPKATRTTRGIGELKEIFLRIFPGGFDDPQFLEQERNYKDAAHHKLSEILEPSSVAALLDAGRYSEVCIRARRVIQATNLIDHHEPIDLDKNTAREDGHAARYAHGLADLLYGSGAFQARFENFVDVLEQLGGAKWTIATYFPFLAFPSEHLFLKPEATKYVARACGFELNYRPHLNWRTYETLLRFAQTLEQNIADLKPKDRIDLQSFIWRVWKLR